MHLKTLTTVCLAAAVFLAACTATPLPMEATGPYVPLSKRVFTPESLAKDVELSKRSSAGFNDWSCKVSKKHPNPIIFLHGLGSNGVTHWVYMGPRFALEGYCAFSLTYGQYKNIPILGGLDKMENSAQELSDFVDKVLASTGATKVNLFGHSEGSVMPRYYLRFLKGASKVAKFAAIGPATHGTDLWSLVPYLTGLGLYDPIKKVVDPLCLACFQVLVDSPFLKNLNEGGDTVPGVEYYFIVSNKDFLITPFTNGYIRDKSPLVKNVLLQDLCAVDLAGHITVMSDPIVFHAIKAFYDPSASQTINCLDAFH